MSVPPKGKASRAPEPSAPAATPWLHAAPPGWAAGIAVPDFLALREGNRPLVIVAPHGGRRRRAFRRGDSVNDLHTAEIAWELAERTGAHAIVNHGLDRNEIDLNRITHLTARAPGVLALLRAAIDAAGREGEVPFVVFLHGWNMVVPCCDIGIGVRRRGGQLTGRYPTLSSERYNGSIAAIELELKRRGISAAIGRRYTASGRDNAAQLFSGRHLEHENPVVAALGRLAIAGRVDAAQLELGIPLRWPGPARESLVDGLVAALSGDGLQQVREIEPDALRDEHDDVAVPREAGGWRLRKPDLDDDASGIEPGFALQAVLDPDGGAAMFCGVESNGPRAMAVRFSIVCTDGTMLLLVDEGEWDGRPGCYALDGFTWHALEQGRQLEISIRAPLVRYRTHEAYLDLEAGLTGCELVESDVTLAYEAISTEHGRLRGHIRAGGLELDVDTIAFPDRAGRRGSGANGRIRIVTARDERDVAVVRSDSETKPCLEVVAEGERSLIRPVSGLADVQGLVHAEILARVPVWRPLGEGVFSRWTFGIVRCSFSGDSVLRAGLFDSLEVFRRPAASPRDRH